MATVAVKPSVVVCTTSGIDRGERLAMAMAWLKSNKYLNARQYSKMTGLSKSAAEAELDAFSRDKDCPIVAIQKGEKKIVCVEMKF